MNTINGITIARTILANVREQVEALHAPLHIAAVCIGSDPSLQSFVRIKQRTAQSAGILFSSYFFDEAQRAEAETTMRFLAQDDTVHGIFVELPLPLTWDREAFLALIPIEKDVDGISPASERLFFEDVSSVLPPAVKALSYIVDAHHLDLAHVAAVVVGHGMLVGKPIAHWLRAQHAQVEVVELETPHPAAIASRAQLLIAGTGVPELVTSNWIQDGATVIDFGCTLKDGVYVGDVARTATKDKSGLVTPVPGGTGPLVVAAVLENLVDLATR